MTNNKNYGLATLGVRAGQTPDPATGAQADSPFKSLVKFIPDLQTQPVMYSKQELLLSKEVTQVFLHQVVLQQFHMQF